MHDIFREILIPISNRLRDYLKNDMEMEVLDEKSEVMDSEHLVLKENTVFIGTGGSVQLFITMGFEKELLEKLVKKFYWGEELEDKEFLEMQESVACEISNTVIGNVIKNPVDSSIISISPPILIHDAKSLTKYKNSIMLKTDIVTDIGNVQMAIIGPQELFLDKLDLKGNIKC
ncbi:MAG: chemotaxis protein CheX [Arcobacter sp.]|uniref:chemotaxis protein CheX n=1 Tax=Arcobacter sp. TaxID=1872629 RepID=UPI003B00B0DE